MARDKVRPEQKLPELPKTPIEAWEEYMELPDLKPEDMTLNELLELKKSYQRSLDKIDSLIERKKERR